MRRWTTVALAAAGLAGLYAFVFALSDADRSEPVPLQMSYADLSAALTDRGLTSLQRDEVWNRYENGCVEWSGVLVSVREAEEGWSEWAQRWLKWAQLYGSALDGSIALAKRAIDGGLWRDNEVTAGLNHTGRPALSDVYLTAPRSARDEPLGMRSGTLYTYRSTLETYSSGAFGGRWGCD